MWALRCLFRSLTTSWVCASQSAKSIRFKKGENKGFEASGFPDRHGNMQRTHCGFFPSSSVFLELCSARTTRPYRILVHGGNHSGHVLSFARKTVVSASAVGASASFQYPSPVIALAARKATQDFSRLCVRLVFWRPWLKG